MLNNCTSPPKHQICHAIGEPPLCAPRPPFLFSPSLLFHQVFPIKSMNRLGFSSPLIMSSDSNLTFYCRQTSYCSPRPEIQEHSGEEERHMLHRRPRFGRAPRLSHRHHRHCPQPPSGHQKVIRARRVAISDAVEVFACVASWSQLLHLYTWLVT